LLFVERSQILLVGPVTILMVGVLLPPSQAALYAVADRLAGFITVFLTPLHQVTSSRVVASLSGTGSEEPPGRISVEKMRRYSVALGGSYFAVAAVCIFGADHLVHHILGAQAEGVTPVFRLLALAVAIQGVAVVLVGVVLFPLQHDRLVAISGLVRMGFTLMAVATLTWTGGVMGAGIGRVVSSACAVAFIVWCLHSLKLLAPLSKRG
jgi:O-antigen/teichoic acid export membrane protein